MADEAKPSDGEGAEPRLPVVESPNLDGSEPAAPYAFASTGEHASEASGEAAASEPLSRSLRFALLAASIAAAAALGSFVGSLSASGISHLMAGAADNSNVTAASALQAAAKAELAELAALKAGLDGASRSANGQFAKLADRLDRAERVQIESATKLARVADAADGMEKKMAAAAAAAAVPQVTGSIANSPPATPAEAKLPDKILRDWIVQDVRAGHALVENRYGGVFNIAAGGVLPGLGRVETIKRQDGQWIVVTAGGLIAEHN